ncbi:single-stranded DNA-binding protein [Bradyrhizobium sp. CCBAU 051011]|uniref:ERF family protein n=1 Tax=Bradyrhizobium sp. CCBAU 051011 TaxID=858422 RepID=UPI001374625A|nr:ERF family protein [Bradyrhizobium sp. CCBAU 051011]QHO78245.1 single-stranded DNA-binding protein [Bradyrhizobium sp. CCBAU 051011]
MQRSSNKIGTLAAALAKAQSEIANPEKSLTATIESPFPREGQRTFRYASLSVGLDIVRKCLGLHEIATVQSTAIDRDSGLIRLTTTLVHASGEWVSSDWPVCPASETAAPHRMGAALTYARRYALFTLVGIAGEDDLDAPETLPSPRSTEFRTADSSRRKQDRNVLQRPPTLSRDQSAQLKDQMLGEILSVATENDLLTWAQNGLLRKNALLEDDARLIETAYQQRLAEVTLSAGLLDGSIQGEPSAQGIVEEPVAHLAFPKEPVRKRSKAHLSFVRSQPCLICKQMPSDPHHLKFAQTKALGHKVSDEFTVPLCRTHHQDLHRHGNEKAWWANMQIAPMPIAKRLWDASQTGGQGGAAVLANAAHTTTSPGLAT